MSNTSALNVSLAAAIGSVVFPFTASGHHSRAEFSDEILDVPGELVTVAWRNPHPVLTIKVTNGAGEEELWRVEGWSSANSLDRQGVTADAFRVGDEVRVAVQASTRREGVYLGRSVLLPDGAEAILRPGRELFWSGADLLAPSPSGVPDAGDNEARGIFRVWTFVDREGGGGPNLPLTEAARAQIEGFDELRDHPLFRCEPVGMPIAMDSTLPIQFVEQRGNIIMRSEQNDVARTIHMSPGATARGQAATPLGYSVGRWEGNTLVVSTSRIDYPYLNDDGVPMSDGVEIVERFILSENEQTLDWRATVTDPQNFTEPVEITARWRSVPDETIKPWNCARWPEVR